MRATARHVGRPRTAAQEVAAGGAEDVAERNLLVLARGRAALGPATRGGEAPDRVARPPPACPRHVAALAFLGGVPKRIVVDNLTAGITHADRDDPRVNRAYGELARHDGCFVDPARVAHPKDTPRVERNVQYARASCFAGRTSGTLAALRAEAARWCREVAGQRVHGTTGERPFVAFQAREAAALRLLPPQPWEHAT